MHGTRTQNRSCVLEDGFTTWSSFGSSAGARRRAPYGCLTSTHGKLLRESVVTHGGIGNRPASDFFVTERSGPVPVWEASNDDSASSSDEPLHGSGRVLEAWIPFECRCNLEGTYDLSCSAEIFVADTSDDPRESPCERERRRADPDGLIGALRGCAPQSAIPHVEV